MFIQIQKQIFVWMFILSTVLTGTAYTPVPASTQIASVRKANVENALPKLTDGDSISFGIIGDYGDGSQAEADVANRVKGWDPDFITTTGDNNYPDGGASTIDAHIGQYYHDFIYPYTGTYGAGATTNRFFPILGNNDLDTLNGEPYLDYFTLPDNERYYDYVWGPVHFFMLDSDDREPDGNTSSSTQATWLHNQLTASTSTWNIVYLHRPPYTSGTVGSSTKLQWPFAAWGADAVLSGHSHTYERIFQNGIVYFVNGLGGDSIHSFSTPISGSQVRYNSNYGAMLVAADTSQITFQFITRTGTVVDTYTLHSLSSFSKVNPSNGAANQPLNVTLSWNPSADATSYAYCVDTTNDNACNGSWVNNGMSTSKALSGLNPNTRYYWQVRAVNSSGTVMANDGTWWSFTTIACYTLSRSVVPAGSGAINASPAPNCNGGTQYTAGTVVQLTASPAINYAFTSWSGDISGSSNPVSVTMSASKSVTANFIKTGPASMDVYIGGTKQGSYSLAQSESTRQEYPDLNNGPMKVISTDASLLMASQRVIFLGKSYSEMMGLPLEQLSKEYWFPYYNNVAMNSQLRVSNLGGSSTTIKVYLGTQQIDSYSLAAGSARRWNYDAQNGGPLRVTSSDTNILATIRVLYASSSYSEMMGLPKEQLSREYLFPYYNNVAMNSQLRVSNVGGVNTTINVYLGSNPTPIDSYSLAAGGATRKNYSGQNSGPLRVTSSASDILTTIRVLYNTSYSEMMGLPVEKLSKEYWYPVYDNSSLNSQLRVSNVGVGPTTITVYAGSDPIDSYSLAAGGAVRRNYVQNTGPLHVVSSSQPILSTIRMLYTPPNFISYYEMTGLPDTQLSTEYFFPWYNNVAMSSELRFAVPNP